MRFVRFACHLGIVLSLIGAADCFVRYQRMADILELYERIAEPSPRPNAYAEIMAGHPRSEFAVRSYNIQQEIMKTQQQTITVWVRGIQSTLRDQGVLFGMLLALFGVAAVRLRGTNNALQGGR